MSIFNDLEKDLIKRTKANLDFIIKEKEKGDVEVYETTQLFNSLLGIVVNIKEKSIRATNFESIILNDDEKKNWSIPNTIKDDTLKEDTLADFLVNLRNAVAHLDLTFMSRGSGKIKTLDFNHHNNWKCVFPVEDLHKFLNKLCDYVETH